MNLKVFGHESIRIVHGSQLWRGKQGQYSQSLKKKLKKEGFAMSNDSKL